MTTSLRDQSTNDFIKLLAPDIRWQIINILKFSDSRVQELVDRLDQPKNLLSYHLKQLRSESLVTYRRSDADRRDYYYTLNIPHLQKLYQEVGKTLNLVDSLPDEHYILAPDQWVPPARVLFLCTHNAARSQMAEAFLRYYAGNNVEVYSAGSQPSHVHPRTIEVMQTHGININHQESIHFDDLVTQEFDEVITVCDHVREVCPSFDSAPTQLHWSIPDPMQVDTHQLDEMFRQTAKVISQRVRYLIRLINQKRNS